MFGGATRQEGVGRLVDVRPTVTTQLDPTLAVRLFGQRQFTFNNEPIRFGAPVRALSLLAYLLLNRDKPIARDTLAYTLWPDDREPDARANLRRHLYLLQNEVLPRVAGIAWIKTDARTVQWNPKAPLWLDVAEFERQIGEPETCAAAAELYHGDFLDGVEDEWIEKRREQYRERFLESLLRLATARHARGELSAALGYAKILLQHDPWREDGLRLFMELRHQSGDRAGALREYRDFVRRLKDEMGVEPMPETSQAFERIAAAKDEPVHLLDSSPIPIDPGHNLPRHQTSLHGREQDLANIRSVLEQANLVTLSGAGGVGKTRLAVEVAHSVVRGFPDGAWLVEFATISDPALVVPSLATTLCILKREGLSLAQSVVEGLKEKSLLLVLDNCEHLIDAVARVVDDLLRGCAGVRIVATSREPLRVAGERVCRVPPLGLPAPTNGGLPSLDELKKSAAVRLFLDRASAAAPNFDVRDEDMDALPTICRRLDGIPFAIELAAARLRVLSLRALAERLDDRFRTLGTGDRTALPRHQTLRALLDWSYDLLSEGERQLLHQLTIFAGRFTLEAATTICGKDETEKLRILEILSGLVEKSLVIAEPHDDRYRLLESTRDYARERLHASGEYDITARRYAAFYAQLAQVVDDLYWTLPIEEWLRTVTPETENFLDALHWAFEIGKDFQTGGEIAGSLVVFWDSTPFCAEGKKYVEMALARLPDEPTPVVAQLWLALAQLAERSQLEAAKRAVALHEILGNEHGLGLAYHRYAVAATFEKRHEDADSVLGRAAEIHGRLNRPRMLAKTYEIHCIAHFTRGNFTQALTFAERSRSLYELLDDKVQVGLQTARIAECHFGLTGNAAEALALAREAYTLYGHRSKTLRSGVFWLANLAAYSIMAGEYSEAHTFALEALRHAHDRGFDRMVANCLEHVASVNVRAGAVRRAARLLGYAEGIFALIGAEREPTEIACHEALMGCLKASLSEADLRALREEGAALQRDVAMKEAHAACSERETGSLAELVEA